MNVAEKHIVFIDGYCHICNGLLRFIHKRDKSNHFLFSSLQSKYASQNDKVQAYLDQGVDSVILLTKDGASYTYSDAVIKIFTILGRPYSLLKLTSFCPRVIKDGIYKFVARIRHSFGKRDTCEIPEDRFTSKVLK